MEKLQEITMEQRGQAIQISGNSGLKSLRFPNLRKIESPDDIKIIIVNNPKLGMRRRDVEKMYILAAGPQHAIIEFSDTSSMYDNKDIEVLVANNATFLKEHMLPLAENAAIQADDHFLLCERVKSILSKEVVIMIGSEKEPSCVLPHLPHELKKQHVYKYLGSTYSFTLSRFKRMAPCTIRYTYDVVKATKGKPPQKGIRKIYYHRWETKKLPVEFDEILQLAMLYKPGKTLCVSERRKEVFSLIHMLVTYCRLLKEHIDFKDALQLHTEKCNGTILDRNELVYVMAVIMEWAYQSRSVTPELKEKHVEWCHSYAIMAKFMRKCPNIRLIHPDYLTKLDATVKKRVLQDGFASSPRFSPRESAAAKDPFRRKSTSDKKSEMKSVKHADDAPDDGTRSVSEATGCRR
ncbi:unnamed protein product [Heligmosomoides polygyrus]|uniref:Recep_L_domain domain-containing protein n=1 Tax=Heligmosomoides polygyrus TaxID=6339 RepID=A0A3P8E5Y7_HELPZ|nr:unnamed protein product [Heligmosomoides polygyrus]